MLGLRVGITMVYYYGMKYRPAGMGCQPMEGLIEIIDSDGEDFYDIVTYSRKLTESEVYAYELEFIGAK